MVEILLIRTAYIKEHERSRIEIGRLNGLVVVCIAVDHSHVMYGSATIPVAIGRNFSSAELSFL